MTPAEQRPQHELSVEWRRLKSSMPRMGEYHDHADRMASELDRLAAIEKAARELRSKHKSKSEWMARKKALDALLAARGGGEG